MSSPRVIIVAPAAPGVGGLGAAARDIASGLTACGASVIPVTPAPAPSVVQHVVRRRPLRRFDSLSRAADRRDLRRRIPQGWEISYSMPGFMPAGSDPRRRVAHAATHHPSEVRAAVGAARRRTGGGRGFMTAAEAELMAAELHRADVVRAESRAVADELTADPELRGTVVLAPPGVDLQRFAPAAKASQLTVAFVGTLSLWKGVDVLAALAGRLRGNGIVATVGGPVCPWSRRLSAGAQFVARSNVPELLASAHALVLPSVSDGFGYVVLEAMASGAVPFVTPAVGAAEIVTRLDERLVQSSEDFAENVCALLDSLPLDELGVRARELAGEYDQHTMGRRAAELVLSACRER